MIDDLRRRLDTIDQRDLKPADAVSEAMTIYLELGAEIKRLQENPNIGFQPIFLITCTLYIVASVLMRFFFQRRDDQQRRAAFLRRMGIPDLTTGRQA